MVAIYSNQAGTWKEISAPYVKTNTTWKDMKNVYVKVNGVWKLIYEGAIVVTNSSTVANYNLFAQAGSPSGAVNIVFNNNGIIYATSTGTAALRITGFGSGSSIHMTNNSFIYAKGGNGGNGSDGDGGSSNGGAGGDAVSLGNHVSIDNPGWIYGGGGGGGGGGGATFNGTSCSIARDAAGGGGGGGQSYSVSSGGNGPSSATNGAQGTISGGGIGGTRQIFEDYLVQFEDPKTGCWGNNRFTFRGGDGGNGGSFGSAGATGLTGAKSGHSDGTNRTTVYPGDPGGAAGRAIRRNGFTVTWTSGEARVSGLVS